MPLITQNEMIYKVAQSVTTTLQRLQVFDYLSNGNDQREVSTHCGNHLDGNAAPLRNRAKDNTREKRRKMDASPAS